MVSSIKPRNYDITFDPGQPDLIIDLSRRMKTLVARQTDITRREQDILKHIDKGMSSKEIATHLFIAKTTVDTHRKNMLHKWDLPNTAALLKRAREEAWI
jgi:DNA-binding NarL/FixJ family response regulator